MAGSCRGLGPLGSDTARVLGDATEVMLDLARVGPGFSSNILSFARDAASKAHLENIETRVLDGENIDLPEESFDAVISRVGLIYFPDQHKALTGMRRVLRPGGRVAAITYSTPENNKFFSIPVSLIRKRANCRRRFQANPAPSVSVHRECCKLHLSAPDSVTFRCGRSRHLFACQQLPTVCGLSASRSALCIRCWRR